MARTLEHGFKTVLCSEAGVSVPESMKIPAAAAGPEVLDVRIMALAAPSGLRKTATLTFAAFMLPVVVVEFHGVRAIIPPQQMPCLNARTPFTNELAGKSPVRNGVY